METANDTIAAIATAPGLAGVAIVRLSGPASLAIADRVIRSSAPPPSQRPAGTFLHGHLHDPDSPQIIDEVIVLIYHAPHSYTREDVVEIQCHGGRTSAARILRATLAAGATTASPGEFTRRAFLNGRIDLLQAEAVCDLISAQSDRAAIAAMEQLGGSLSAYLGSIYNSLLNTAADIEHALDFDEGELPANVLPQCGARLKGVIVQLGELLATWSEGQLLRDGALIVITGQPNVGKSTLLNAILGHERAIVTPTPGTTRDTIEEQVIIDGVPLRLVDTAGLRDADCPIEQQGITRAENCVRTADLLLYVMDASAPITDEEARRLSELPADRSILILNKADLGKVIYPEDLANFTTIPTALTQEGLPRHFGRTILQRLGIAQETAAHAVIAERHRAILSSVRDKLSTPADTLATIRDPDLVLLSLDLRGAIEELGRVTGQSYTDDLLDTIFSRFCVGK